MPGSDLISLSATADGAAWAVNSSQFILRFNPVLSQWEEIPGRLVQVSARSRNRAAGVNAAGQIFLWTGFWYRDTEIPRERERN